jgi:hypothetical protein
MKVSGLDFNLGSLGFYFVSMGASWHGAQRKRTKGKEQLFPSV